MVNYFMKAKYFGPTDIRVTLFSKDKKDENPQFSLARDNETPIPLKIKNIKFQFGTNLYELEAPYELTLGHMYVLYTANYGAEALDMTNAVFSDEFDEQYSYDGPLGVHLGENETSFYLWAPLASNVLMRLTYEGEEEIHVLERVDQGVYTISFSRRLIGAHYTYIIVNNGRVIETVDPYAVASGQNASTSVVADFVSFTPNFAGQKMPPFNQMTEAIIYEASVRDMSSDKTTDIFHKATYRGLGERGRLTKAGNPAGFDYLTSLGFTHLQLMPVYDFVTIDETKPKESYNWGYDPAQYFVPEGSYASEISDPLSRIKELQQLIYQFRDAGIRVNMDVVFNHVYEASTSIFEKVVPGYYFRRNDDGTMSNGSFCGNDLATDRYMVRRLIIDSVVWWMKMYGIDGFRFDLLGIIDLETSYQIEKVARAIKPDVMLYGEGWNMPTNLPNKEKSTQDNHAFLPSWAFFNDSFRDIVKGSTAEDRMADKGFLLGANEYRLGFKFAHLGSSSDLVFPPKYTTAAQSINYVECHDNATVFDKITVANQGESEKEMLARLRLLNSAVMIAFGIPFYHKGQEIGLTKFGDQNSYRSGDRVNQFAYVKLDERYDLALYFKELTKLRKDCHFLYESDPEKIEKMIVFEDINSVSGGAALLIDYINISEYDSPFRSFKVFFNPTKDTIYYDLDDYEKIVFNRAGYCAGKQDTYVKRLVVQPLSFLIVGLRKDDEGQGELSFEV